MNKTLKVTDNLLFYEEVWMPKILKEMERQQKKEWGIK